MDSKIKRTAGPHNSSASLTNTNNFIFQFMMEKLGAPKTHIGLKAIIKEVDEDLDNALTFREFLLIFR